MRKTVSGLLYAFVALPMLLGALFLAGSSPRLLDRATWTATLRDERLWNAMRSERLPLGEVDERGFHFDSGLPQGEMDLGGYRFSGDALVRAAQAALPWEGLRDYSGQALDRVFDVMEGKASGGLDLEPLKRLLDDRSDELALAYVERLPPAAPVAPGAAPAAPSPAATDSKDLRVLPPGVDPSRVAARIEGYLRERIAAIPPSAAIARPDTPSGGLIAARAGLAIGTTWTLVGAAALWAGLAFAAHDAWSRRLRWLGTTLAIPAGIVLGTGLLFRLPVEAALRAIAASEGLGPFLASAEGSGLLAWARDTLSLVGSGWLVSGGVAAALAAAFLGARRAIEAIERPEEP